MRIKIYRKSAPHLDPIITDHFTVQGAMKNLMDLGEGANVLLMVDGMSTLIMSSDVSYLQLTGE